MECPTRFAIIICTCEHHGMSVRRAACARATYIAIGPLQIFSNIWNNHGWNQRIFEQVSFQMRPPTCAKEIWAWSGQAWIFQLFLEDTQSHFSVFHGLISCGTYDYTGFTGVPCVLKNPIRTRKNRPKINFGRHPNEQVECSTLPWLKKAWRDSKSNQSFQIATWRGTCASASMRCWVWSAQRRMMRLRRRIARWIVCSSVRACVCACACPCAQFFLHDGYFLSNAMYVD